MNQVRLAVESDLVAIVELAQIIHLESRFAWIPFRANRVWRAIQARLVNPNFCSIVAYNDKDELIGFLQGQRERYDFASAWVANLRYWYVAPSVRGTMVAMKLFTGFKQWAQKLEVVEISIATVHGNGDLDAATQKLLKKLGMQIVSQTFSRWTTT